MGTGPESAPAPSVRAFRTTAVLARKLRCATGERLRTDGLTTQQATVFTAAAALGESFLAEADPADRRRA
ncbi:hypothetical protein E1218_00075 [Kribbella turkmenica]|uniref:MarR family transcriptional regulator n=1 Tax=Kribbella turkmenica TaxID=2530375 RepID=A0A4R4XJ77_9ACTN|nr:hypothetical protein [Kribbella turkmenica]TDD30749.1 hypothetical protein E1218_00075 [Kribbella turkmenica]